MFERFRDVYASRRDPVAKGAPWSEETLLAADGYEQFAAEFAGASFAGGLYRVHEATSGPRAVTLIEEAFGDVAGRVRPFGYDWLGRQFALDAQRIGPGGPQVLIVDAGVGETVPVPMSLAHFHDHELTEYADAAMAAGVFAAWSAAHPELLPLGRDQCVGYRVPSFLGGPDELDNLQLTDLVAYWSTCARLRRGESAS